VRPTVTSGWNWPAVPYCNYPATTGLALMQSLLALIAHTSRLHVLWPDRHMCCSLTVAVGAGWCVRFFTSRLTMSIDFSELEPWADC
jgi:hypothetical protein